MAKTYTAKIHRACTPGEGTFGSTTSQCLVAGFRVRGQRRLLMVTNNPALVTCRACLGQRKERRPRRDKEAEQKVVGVLSQLRHHGLVGVLAQLRHAYKNLMDPANESWGYKQLRSFADGLIAPQIRTLEALDRALKVKCTCRAIEKCERCEAIDALHL